MGLSLIHIYNLVESRRLVDSGNTALDTVLNYMLQRAVDKKIQLNVKVVVPCNLNLSLIHI